MHDINTLQILSKNCYLLSNPFSRFRGLVAYESLNHRRGVGGTHLACVASVSNRVIARKLEQEQKKKVVIPFFCSCPSFS